MNFQPEKLYRKLIIILHDSQVAGSLFATLMFRGKPNIPSSTRMILYSALTVISTIGALGLVALRNPKSAQKQKIAPNISSRPTAVQAPVNPIWPQQAPVQSNAESSKEPVYAEPSAQRSSEKSALGEPSIISDSPNPPPFSAQPLTNEKIWPDNQQFSGNDQNGMNGDHQIHVSVVEPYQAPALSINDAKQQDHQQVERREQNTDSRIRSNTENAVNAPPAKGKYPKSCTCANYQYKLFANF